MQEKQWHFGDLEIRDACSRMLAYNCTPLECVIVLTREGYGHAEVEQALLGLGCVPVSAESG